MRNQTCSSTIFSLGCGFRRKVNRSILGYDDFSGLKLTKKPFKFPGKLAQWGRLKPLYSGRRQNDKRPILLEFAKSSAIELKELPKYGLRNLNFELDFFDGHIRKSCGQICEHTFESQKLFDRCAVQRGLANCSPSGST